MHNGSKGHQHYLNCHVTKHCKHHSGHQNYSVMVVVLFCRLSDMGDFTRQQYGHNSSYNWLPGTGYHIVVHKVTKKNPPAGPWD